MTNLAGQLAEGIAGLGLALPAEVRPRLLDYLALMQKWNKTYNLTAVREPSKMVSHHVLDSLAVAPHLDARTILDVGSGAGLPGIPLAIALPQAAVTLLESNHKKAAFLQQAKTELKLDNVTVACERVEKWQPGTAFEVVTSRAFSDLAEFVALAGRHATPHGRLAAMKGIYPHEEITQLPAGWRLDRSIELTVPGLRGERHLLLIGRP
ncbi:MAG TPA: 16S rRNA (guanine(527)-N(7))-methyltransferase RsmG [Burkholderiales bacterium]|nr:16S rRNA (guanine(527)-N(7))-methyltransferase RsmG [Burkholderiales bacterium]